jgi:hypothetical protein
VDQNSKFTRRKLKKASGDLLRQCPSPLFLDSGVRSRLFSAVSVLERCRFQR